MTRKQTRKGRSVCLLKAKTCWNENLASRVKPTLRPWNKAPGEKELKRKTLFGVSALVLSALLLTTAAAHFFQIDRPGQSTSKPAVDAHIVTFPFELANRHVIIKVKINDSRPLSFVLDTGDQYAIVDLKRARELGLKLEGEIRVSGAGSGSAVGAYVRDSTFSIPGFAGFSQPVTLALPVANMAPRLGQDFDGIIGYDFIKNFVVELDYQARVIKLHDKDRFSYSGPGESIPVELTSDGHPIIEAEVTPLGLEPARGKFVVDIGSGLALALYSPFVTNHKLLGPGLKTIRALGAGGAGGTVSGQIGRVDQLKIGAFKIDQPITFFAEDKAGAFASSEVLGNIGAQVMNRFRVLLDYKRNRIILEPNSNFGKPYDRAFSGLSLQADGQDYRIFRITAVLENSPASESGLQKDDIIAAIDGKPASELSLAGLTEMFEREVAYELTVRRGEQTLRVKLTPRRLV